MGSYSSPNSYFASSLIGLVILTYRTIIYPINSLVKMPADTFLWSFFSSSNAGKTSAIIFFLVACWQFLQVMIPNLSRSQVSLMILNDACVAPFGQDRFFPGLVGFWQCFRHIVTLSMADIQSPITPIPCNLIDRIASTFSQISSFHTWRSV